MIRTRFKEALALLLLLHIGLVHADAGIGVRMRDMGYTLGDEIDATVTVPLKPGESLDMNSLPALGRMTPWLELRAVDAEDHAAQAVMKLRWQVFATVEHAMLLRIPAFEIRLQGAGKSRTVKVPSSAFHMSPVLPDPLESEAPREDLPPPGFDERTPLWLGLLGVAISLSSGLWWLWLTDRLPGLPRNPGPWTMLSRRLKHASILDMSLLRAVHAAMNTVAGETLYPGTLETLFARAPYLEGLRAEIEAFFRLSWQCFYAESREFPAREDTVAWVRLAAQAERARRS